MTQRASESLVAVLIRIGLLLALAVLLMAENAQARPLTTSAGSRQVRPGIPTSRQLHAATGTRTNRKT
jgi:hypothetical protein